MAEAYKEIAKIVPTAMATGLVKHNIDEILKKKKKKSIMKLGAENIIGTSMIQAVAQAGGY